MDTTDRDGISGNGSRPFFTGKCALDEETAAAKAKRAYQQKEGWTTARYAELQKKEPKPEQEGFTANGKRYVSIEHLSRNEIYKLLHARTKGKYEVEAFYRDWERSKDTRRRPS